jgi:hypothetical protein
MLNRKRLTFAVLILLIIVSVRFLPGCGQGLNILTDISSGGAGTGVDWSQWTYRRSITISNSGTAQTDYQVNVIIENDTDFYTKTAVNGDDIRFNFNNTSLPYWIESWDSGATHKFSVWAKVPSIAASGDTVIYLYYGNSGLTAASDFDNTFTKDSGFSGLAAQWHMDEGSGTFIADSSGNTNDGTITDAVWLAADGGRWFDRADVNFSAGGSLSFNGTTAYVTVPDNDSLDVGSITIGVWIKTSSDVTTTTQFIVSKWTEIGNLRSYALGSLNGKIRFYTSPDGGSIDQDILVSTSTLIADTWYHIAVTSNVTNKKIFINGTLDVSSIAGTYNINAGVNATSDLYVGIYDLAIKNYYKSIIDEVSIYNTALTENQIKAFSQRRKHSPDVGDTPVVGVEEVVP